MNNSMANELCFGLSRCVSAGTFGGWVVGGTLLCLENERDVGASGNYRQLTALRLIRNDEFQMGFAKIRSDPLGLDDEDVETSREAFRKGLRCRRLQAGYN